MKKYIIAACFLLASTPSLVWSEAKSEPRAVVVPESQNQVIKLTDQGVVPQTLHMKVDDSIVFLLNDSSDSLATLELEFGEKRSHCASGNLRIRDDGKVVSKRPFGPKEFASVCFHDPGTYPLKIFGLKKNSKGVDASIVVE